MCGIGILWTFWGIMLYFIGILLWLWRIKGIRVILCDFFLEILQNLYSLKEILKRSPISIFLGISSYIQKLCFWELDPYLRVPFFCGQRNFPLCLWHRHGMVPNLLFVLPSCLPHLPTPSIISRLSPAPPFLPPMIFFTSPFLNKPPIEVAGGPTWFGHSLRN